ncbi:olfactory receptor 1019-like [Sphaerodactylus townsendi]|uniref:olfactory receptor 1019-like n=1 Tax=Sphaerodactylus townsendi TaxID=933632 RepID=UPI00202705D2|nr:olfactory receptor 1019-like [Sphaerodactylus townsendi]
MSEENQTVITEFIFVGLTQDPVLQRILFMIFLIIYIISLMGNLSLIILISASSQLHTPMYFFLSNLSFLDICYSSVVAPQTLVNSIADKKSISLARCATQLYFFIALGTTECCLLAVMAYDRYVAICSPLLYPVLMSPKVCIPLVIGSYTLGIFHSLVHTTFTFKLSFCGSNKINHFYCDITPLLSISCSDTYVSEVLLFSLVGGIEIITILAVVISYTYILATILRIHSVQGRQKAFSTCVSHFTGVTIYHGTILFMYLRPTSSYSLDSDKILAVFYTMAIPLLNPLIYSLRNKDVKEALNYFLKKNLSVHIKMKNL